MLESDVLSLSALLRLDNNMLHDVSVSAIHTLQPMGVPIVCLLQQPHSYKHLRDLAKKYQVTHEQLNELLGFLNMIGGLCRTRGTQSSVRAWATQTRHLLIGILYPGLTYRRTASILTLLTACTQATSLVYIAAIGTCSVLVYGGLASLDTTLYVTLASLGTFWVSIVLHEYTHIIILKRASLSVSVFRAGMQLGLLHTRGKPSTEFLSAITGPFAGAFISILVGMPSIHSYPLLALFCFIIALFHLMSILPWYGDGKSMRSALQERKLCPKVSY